MGSFLVRGNLQIYLKELLGLVPFANTGLGLVMRKKDPLSLEQTIDIRITDILDNSKFQLEKMSLELKNKSLQFKSVHLYMRANLNPFSILFGFRYFMLNWFYTVAAVCISFLATINICVLLILAFGASKCTKVKQN
jgi:hypothetical protein